jgi:L-2-hydroxyglutarate oxidase LhgO
MRGLNMPVANLDDAKMSYTVRARTMAERIDTDILICGAGVIGIACAEALAREFPNQNLLVLERHSRFGCEASSRNSEVIHAGIYYEGLPQKARHCVEGRDLLYSFCAMAQVPHRRCGKFIVAANDGELIRLEAIHAAAARNGVALERLGGARLRTELNHPGLAAGLWSSWTGIVDSHELMARLARASETCGSLFAYGHRLMGYEGSYSGKHVFRICDPEGLELQVHCHAFVNAGGLGAARIARLVRPGWEVEIRPCLGRYFQLSSRWTGVYKSLVYPLPDPLGGLGTHLTIDLTGKARLGPDVFWPEDGIVADDPVHWRFPTHDALARLRQQFLASGTRLLPELALEDLAEDYVGVRAKLFIDGEVYRDFWIAAEGDEPIVNLLGVESPGLTSSLSIAREVSRLVRERW